MKSRILKRPMFKMGGSTDGILSGLDTPRLDASRVSYDRGGDVRKRVETIRGIYDDILPAQDRRGMPGSVSNFLTGFGLNLLAQPGGRNIFQTAAKAAQTPYQQFVSARSKEQAEERALTQAIIGDAIEQESEEEQARLKGIGEFDIGAAAKINQEIDRINTAIRTAESKKATIEAIPEGERTQQQKDDLKVLTGESGTIASLKQQRKKTTGEKGILSDIANILGSEYIANTTSNIMQQINPETNQKYTQEEAQKKAIEMGASLIKEYRADGGRVGYQEGARVDMPSTSKVAALDYTTLRARLPRQIGDDIVRLIADSGEALTDFANIRTQQDVDKFNETYKVNLVLPSED
mgnify:CR=1 FL=1|tara:strand:- start:2889 stop:3941 length:1053 start_codon:yes stop_codon:yes gene_type:complete